MLRINLWSQSVSRVELDQRSRDARLRFERTDEFFVVPRTVMHSRLRRLLYVFTVGRYGGLPHGDGEVKEPPAVPTFTLKQGQYLASIYAYTRVQNRSTARVTTGKVYNSRTAMRGC